MNYHTITKKQRTLDLVFVCLHGAALLNHPPRKKGVPATDFISAERKFTEVCAFARPLAELVTPPTMRHHAETSSTMIADLRLPHPIEAVRVGSLQAAVERAASHATGRGSTSLCSAGVPTVPRRRGPPPAFGPLAGNRRRQNFSVPARL
jgi:hypothetical protein